MFNIGAELPWLRAARRLRYLLRRSKLRGYHLIEHVELRSQPAQRVGGILVGLTLDHLGGTPGVSLDASGALRCHLLERPVRQAPAHLSACRSQHHLAFGLRTRQHLVAALQQLLGRPHLLRHAQPELVDELQGCRPVHQRRFRQRRMPAGSQDVLEPIQVLEQVTARSPHIHGCVLFHDGPADP